MKETQEMWVRSLDQEDSLEEEIATHSSILVWKIPWTEEPGGLHSMGLQRVGHDWATLGRKEDGHPDISPIPTPILIKEGIIQRPTRMTKRWEEYSWLSAISSSSLRNRSDYSKCTFFASFLFFLSVQSRSTWDGPLFYELHQWLFFSMLIDGSIEIVARPKGWKI